MSLDSLKKYLDEPAHKTACGVTEYRDCNVPWGTKKTGIEIDLKGDAGKPVNKIYAYENDDKGLTIAIKKGLPEDERNAVIISSCKMAVESAYNAMLDPTKPKVDIKLNNISTKDKQLIYELLKENIEALKTNVQSQGKGLSDMRIPEITGYKPPAPKLK
jgi:hypothetical protein